MALATSGPNGKYQSNDISIWYWSGNPDPQFNLSILTSAQLGGFSDTGFTNAEYDALFEQQTHELDDANRVVLVHKLQQIAYQQKPYIVLCYLDAFQATTSSWTGVPLTAQGPFPLSSGQWAVNVHRA
jgi:peptide/nickel transport system substrate-binding protein